jgi:hypothetical protein
MATKILLKKSVTGGASPLTADLEQGELAINLVDRKIYTKDSGNNIKEITGAYVDASAPSNPVEGDLWYDAANNLLKTHNGTGFVSAGYQTLSALEDVTLTSISSGDHLKWNGSAFVNSNFESDVEGLLSVANSGTGYGELAYSSGVYTFNKVTSANIRGEVSVTDAGGDGSLAYSSATGVITYTGPSASETRAHFNGGTGVTITNGEVAIGQAVGTSDDVTFNKVTTSLIEGGSTITIDPAGLGDNTGTVVIAGDLTVNGTTTSVNSNEVNIGDSIILLNADEAGTPSQNGGIEIERGTAANKSFVWNEADGKWDLANEELQNVILDGGTY